jgi:hypothetical protein
MVETAVSVLPRMGQSRGKCVDKSKRYENDPSVILPLLQQQQQWTTETESRCNKVTTASAVSTLPSSAQFVRKSIQGVKSYECDSSDPEQQQQQQQSRRQQKNQQQQQRKYRQEKSMNQFGYGSNGRLRGKSSSSSMENGDYKEYQYHVDDNDDNDYNNNTTWMEGLMEEFLESQEMYQDSDMNSKARREKIDKNSKSKCEINSNSHADKCNDKIFVWYCDDILLVLNEETLEVIRTMTLEREQERCNDRKSYSRAVKATRAASRNTKVCHIDGYYKIFEETNSEQSTEVSKGSGSNQEEEQQTAPAQKLKLPPPQVQRQERTTADHAVVCNCSIGQRVWAKNRKVGAEPTSKHTKKVKKENGENWASWKDENGWHSGMNLMVQMSGWNSTRVWDTERTEREGGGKAATVTRFRVR